MAEPGPLDIDGDSGLANYLPEQVQFAFEYGAFDYLCRLHFWLDRYRYGLLLGAAAERGDGQNG